MWGVPAAPRSHYSTHGTPGAPPSAGGQPPLPQPQWLAGKNSWTCEPPGSRRSSALGRADHVDHVMPLAQADYLGSSFTAEGGAANGFGAASSSRPQAPRGAWSASSSSGGGGYPPPSSGQMFITSLSEFGTGASRSSMDGPAPGGGVGYGYGRPGSSARGAELGTSFGGSGGGSGNGLPSIDVNLVRSRPNSRADGGGQTVMVIQPGSSGSHVVRAVALPAGPAPPASYGYSTAPAADARVLVVASRNGVQPQPQYAGPGAQKQQPTGQYFQKAGQEANQALPMGPGPGGSGWTGWQQQAPAPPGSGGSQSMHRPRSSSNTVVPEPSPPAPPAVQRKEVPQKPPLVKGAAAAPQRATPALLLTPHSALERAASLAIKAWSGR